MVALFWDMTSHFGKAATTLPLHLKSDKTDSFKTWNFELEPKVIIIINMEMYVNLSVQSSKSFQVFVLCTTNL